GDTDLKITNESACTAAGRTVGEPGERSCRVAEQAVLIAVDWGEIGVASGQADVGNRTGLRVDRVRQRVQRRRRKRGSAGPRPSHGLKRLVLRTRTAILHQLQTSIGPQYDPREIPVTILAAGRTNRRIEPQAEAAPNIVCICRGADLQIS